MTNKQLTTEEMIEWEAAMYAEIQRYLEEHKAYEFSQDIESVV